MAWPRGGYRKPRHGAGVARRSLRGPACDSGLRPSQLVSVSKPPKSDEGFRFVDILRCRQFPTPYTGLAPRRVGGPQNAKIGEDSAKCLRHARQGAQSSNRKMRASGSFPMRYGFCHGHQLAAAALPAVRLAGPPVPALSPCGPARCGLGRPRMPLVRSCRMPGGRFGLTPRRGLGAAASEAGQGSRSGHESGPYGLASEDAGERKERCRPPRQRPHLGVPGPEAGRSPATATLAGPGGYAPKLRPTGATLSQPARTMRGRSGGHTPPGPARPGAPERSIWRPNASPGGKPARPQQGASQADPSLARGPLTGPALELCGVNFAKSVMRQGFSALTPHN